MEVAVFPGKTLLVDLYNCDQEALASPDAFYQVLSEIPGRLGLRIISAPQLARWDLPQAKSKEDWGYSGTVLFAESHIYGHSWPEKGFVMWDLSVCRDFPTLEVLSLLTQIFSPTRMYYRVEERGRGGEKLIFLSREEEGGQGG